MIHAMRLRLHFPPLPPDLCDRLRARFENAPDPETRTRFQMIWLATEERRSSGEIARLVLHSHDTVQRVLHRFRTGGLDAVPRRTAPGPTFRLPPEAETDLVRNVEENPRQEGVEAANWTTGLLAAAAVAPTVDALPSSPPSTDVSPPPFD
jgi:transposase